MSTNTPIKSHPVLVVDDEPSVVATLRDILQHHKFEVVTAPGPREALELVRKMPFSVILSDFRMPGMTGLEFLVEARKIQPNTSRVLITAVLTLSTIIDAINRGEIFRFIAKPWLHQELIATISNAVQRYDLVEQNARLQSETAALNIRLSELNEALKARLADLETQKRALDKANTSLSTNFAKSLDLVFRMLNTYDPLLGSQIKVVVEICEAMARTSQFTEEEKHVLVTSAWLCDVGLIGVPHELLHGFRTKRELNDAESTILNNHPIYGQALASFVDDLTAVGDTIRAHHERFDGNGYPDARSGKEIPWPARCLAVAVAFVDSGMPKEKAIDWILRQSGTAFDPEAVRLFLKVTHLIQLPRQVREILLDELEPGMRLANGIYNPHGLLLIGEGQELTSSTISKIRNYSEQHQLKQQLIVYS